MNFSQNGRLSDALRRKGAVVVRVDLEGWHYVLLTGIRKDMVYFFDPYYREEPFDTPDLTAETTVDTSIQLGEAEAAAETAADSVGDQIVNTFTVCDFPLVFYKMVELLMKLAPLGLLAYFANLTGTYGAELLTSYARGLLIYYPAALLYFFVFLALYAFYEISLCCALFAHPLNSVGDYAFALVIAVAGSVAVSSAPGGGAAMETMVLSAFGFPSVALPVPLMMTQLFDAGCTLINSCGDTVASMLVTRVL